MKFVSIIIAILLATSLSMAQSTKGSEIQFVKETYDYDTILQGSNGNCQFVFTNTGTEPLIIISAFSSCGCTTTGWKKTPVFPGEADTITIKYNTEILGAFRKKIVVKSNAANAPTTVLCLQGFVREKPKRQPKRFR